MAKKKTRTLWLYKCTAKNHYWLCDGDNEGTLFDFCGVQLRKLCPNLVKGQRKGQDCKIKLTDLKNGIKLEKVK